MIRIKTASNETKEITKVYVKTGASTVQSISEAYQVYDDNGVKALKRVFGYSPDNVVAPTLVAWPDHDENGQQVPFVSVKVTPVDAADTIELSFVQYHYQEAKGEPYWFEWKPDPEGNGDYWFEAASCATGVLVKARSKRNGVYSSENTQMVSIADRDVECYGNEGLDENLCCIICGQSWAEEHVCYPYRYESEPDDAYTYHKVYCACENLLYTEECTFDDDTHECKYCDKRDPDYEEPPIECSHAGGTATCKTQAICSKCGEPYGSLAGHTEVTDPAVAATCTAKGKTEGKHCSECSKVLVAQTEVAALGHEAADGWIGGGGNHWHLCKNNCGTMLDVDACDTDLIEQSSNGYQHVISCSVCDLEHTWEYEDCFDFYETVKAASCIAEGTEQCSKCGRVSTISIDETAHRFGEGHEHDVTNLEYYSICLDCGARDWSGNLVKSSDDGRPYAYCPECQKTFPLM